MSNKVLEKKLKTALQSHEKAQALNDATKRSDAAFESFEKNLDADSSKIKRTKKVPYKTKKELKKYIDDTYDASKRESAAHLKSGGRAKFKVGGAAKRGISKILRKK